MNDIDNTSTSSRRPIKVALGLVALAAAVAFGYGIALWRARSHETPANHAASPAGAAAGASAPAAERRILYWHDPMVPQHHFDKPGKSPFMDMDLVPKYADEDPGSATGVKIDPRVAQSLGMRVAEVKRETLAGELVALATVGFSERDVAVVQSRTAGFVERVAPLAPGDVVARGAMIAQLLVPEWAGAQQEYLAVKGTGDAALIAASRQRLRLLGMDDALVAAVERTGRPQATLSIVAPIAGVVQEVAVRNGMSVSAGMTLARINGLATMWMEAAVPETQAAMLAPGRGVQARLPAYPGDVFQGSVIALLPEANRETRTLRVRMAFANRGHKLKAGMTAQVALPGRRDAVLVIPAEAVVRTGRRTLVYLVEAEGRYRPVAVELGRDAGDKVEVRSGLAEGQRVVSSGQFLVDSEASLSGVLPSGEVVAAPASAPTGR